MLYLDTSALLPYYREKAASTSIQAMLSRHTRPVLISHLTRVEFASALERWVRLRELTEPQANHIESAFHEDVAEGRLLVRPFEPTFHWLLTRKTALRALDALHLVCAESLNTALVILDATMRSAATSHGLSIHEIPNN